MLHNEVLQSIGADCQDLVCSIRIFTEEEEGEEECITAEVTIRNKQVLYLRT